MGSHSSSSRLGDFSAGTGKLAGFVTRGDLVRMLERQETDELTVLEAGSSKLVPRRAAGGSGR